MKRSTDRVLTTIAGSLPRPDGLAEMHVARQEGEPVDETAFEEAVRSAVDQMVASQVEVGVDIVSDGEMSKSGYIDYTRTRLGGLTGGEELGFYFSDLLDVPELAYAIYKDTHFKIPTCDGAITYTGIDEVGRDVENLRKSLVQHPATEGFIPAISPGKLGMCYPNKHYSSYDEYVFALADAMHFEYKAITDGDFLVQVDAPDLGMGADFHTWMWSEIEQRGFDRLADLHVDALNRALDGIPSDRVRLHLCWANYMGPHTHDRPLRDVLRAALRANVGAITFEAANPAHAHEWELFEDLKVPEDKVMIPGVIDTKSQVVENPRAVAHRIVQFVRILGQENVIAGTDCGFGTFVGLGTVHPKVTWLKLQALVEGAGIASDELSKTNVGR
jgi:5-methyltetrahydropteroyltriglutamate--homocysteine methyltransferase